MPDWLGGVLCWLWDRLTSDGFAVFAGAFFGAVFGYVGTVLFDRRETRARRDVLVRSLREEIEPWQERTFNRFVMGLPNWVDQIPIASIDHLLDGHVLDARNDADLIVWLVRLRRRPDQHNEYVRVHNETHFTRLHDVADRSVDYSVAHASYRRWLRVRHEVLKELDRKGYGLTTTLPPQPVMPPEPDAPSISEGANPS